MEFENKWNSDGEDEGNGSFDDDFLEEDSEEDEAFEESDEESGEENEKEIGGDEHEEVVEVKKIAREDDNVIFIGSKPLVNYIRGIITQFSKHNASEVVVKARGKFISKAVDAVEVAKRSLQEQGARVTNIQIASESFETAEKKTNISTIDITLAIG